MKRMNSEMKNKEHDFWLHCPYSVTISTVCIASAAYISVIKKYWLGYTSLWQQTNSPYNLLAWLNEYWASVNLSSVKLAYVAHLISCDVIAYLGCGM